MGLLDFDKSESKWNYHDASKPNYMPVVTGTVVEISTPQHKKYKSHELEYWEDGNPKLDICVTIQGQSGREVDWQFQPTKNNPGMLQCIHALKGYLGDQAKGVQDLLGLSVTLSTWEPSDPNFKWGPSNPRPWSLVINGPGNQAVVRGVKDTSNQPRAVVQQPQQMMQAPQQQYANQQMQQPMQQQPMQTVAQAQMYTMPQQQQQQPMQQMQQQMQQQLTQQMKQQLVQQMQQQDEQSYDQLLDEDIPF